MRDEDSARLYTLWIATDGSWGSLWTLLGKQTLMQFYQHPSRQGSAKTKSKGSKLLTFLFTLRREIESLNSLAEKKYFTLLPEASITNAHIRLDTRCMAYIAKKLEALTGSSADKLAKDRDLVWKSLFDLEKMKQLKKKWKFSETITTDGVGVSILFERNIPTPPNMKIPKTDPVFLNAFDRGLLWESQVKFEPEATSSQHYRFIAIDPGIKKPGGIC